MYQTQTDSKFTDTLRPRREMLRGVIRDKNVSGEGHSHTHAHTHTHAHSHTCAHTHAGREAAPKPGLPAVAAVPQAQTALALLSQDRSHLVGRLRPLPRLSPSETGGRATFTPRSSTRRGRKGAPSPQPDCPSRLLCALLCWASAVTLRAAREAWPRESVHSTERIW